MKDGEKSLTRVFEIVEAVARSRDGLPAAEVAAQLNLPVSTVFRMVKFLISGGYLRREGARCMLGPGLLRLGNCAQRQNPLARIAHARLEALAGATCETVHLAELRDERIVYVDKVEGSRSVRMGSLIGSTGPLYCTGVGKVLLAFQEEAKQREIVMRIRFEPFTPRTIRKAEALLEELARIRERGYAVDDCEHELGVFCIAAPVLDASGYALAGISLSGSELYLRNRAVELAGLVVATAGEISRAFCG